MVRYQFGIPHCFGCVTACIGPLIAIATPSAVAQQIPMSFRLGPYSEITNRPRINPGVGLRSLVSIASVGELRLDYGVRRPEFSAASGTVVQALTATLHYNTLGGYPARQWGLFGGYQAYFDAEHGHEILGGISTATSHARGEHVQYELSFGRRVTRGRPTRSVWRFKVIVLRMPPTLRKVPQPPPLTLVADSLDAGGAPSNPHWLGARGRDVDRMCHFYYVQMSATPLLVYRPECDPTGLPTLNQPLSARGARHSGFSCGVKDVEPMIHGHLNWTVINQTGRVRWRGFNSGPNGDHDFNLLLEAPALVTHSNHDGRIELEFHAGETAVHFDSLQGGPLWSSLIALPRLQGNSASYRVEDSIANALFSDRRAVVTGLLGLDGEHDYHTELHPVLALAVDVTHETNDPAVETWLVLVRNMGNEGECGLGELPWVLPDTSSTDYALEIPWKPGADSVAIEVPTSFGFIARRLIKLQLQRDPARALRVVADLPHPVRKDSMGIVYGTLWLRWYDHGRPLHNIRVSATPAAAYQRPHLDRDQHPADSLGTGSFPPTRRLCFTIGEASPVSRIPPTSFRRQTVLRDKATDAPPAVLDSCAAAEPPAPLQ